MATLPEESKFDEGVYQIELTDSVVGGPNGISNAPLRSLANRTRWLKDKVAELVSSLGGKADKVHAHTVATPSSPGFMSAADKTKLDGVASGAQANAVTSVAGRSGAVALTVGDVSGAAPKASPRFSGVVAIDAGTTVDFNHEQGAKVYVPAKKAGDLTAPEAVSKYTLTDYAAPRRSPEFTEGATFSGEVVFNGSAQMRAISPETDRSFKVATTLWVRNAMANIASTAGFRSSGRFWTDQNQNTSGWIELPSWLGGFRIQWVSARYADSYADGRDYGVAVTWPVAFREGYYFSLVSGHPGSGNIFTAGPRLESQGRNNRTHVYVNMGTPNASDSRFVVFGIGK